MSGTDSKRIYYTPEMVMQLEYYRFPKWLFNYSISSDAKILYMYLYNLISASADECLYITANQIEKELNITQFTRRKILKELKDANLIRRVNRGIKTRTYVCIPSFKKEIEMEDGFNE